MQQPGDENVSAEVARQVSKIFQKDVNTCTLDVIVFIYSTDLNSSIKAFGEYIAEAEDAKHSLLTLM